MQELNIRKIEGLPLLVQSKGIEAPIAIKAATGRTEKEILNAVAEVANKPKNGMSIDEVKKVLKKLGVNHRDISKVVTKDKEGDSKLNTQITEKEFIETVDESRTYIVQNRNHTWAIVGKEIVDPVWVVPNPKATRRRIVSVIEISAASGDASSKKMN